ncbi:MAG: adenosylcobinamide-GDP ribazoletransferase [Pseudomonadota bacterium]
MKNEGAVFLLAVQFLTRLPIGSAQLYTPERMAASVRYYPLVGGLVGAFSALVFYLATLVFPASVSILFAIAAGLLITGAFHEDGLADTFDGIGGGVTRERALEIMKDSRLGTYGTLALITVLAFKAVALMVLPLMLVPIALIASHGLSRLSSILVIATSRYVRDEGTGKPIAGGISAGGLLLAGLTGLAIVACWFVFYSPLALLWAGGGLFLGHCLMRLFFERKLGGYTGDTLGAVQQLSEVGFYLGLVAWI